MLTAIVISQGDEITSGDIVDENGPWLRRQLIDRGHRIIESRTIPDNLERLIATFRECAELADSIWVTGGLGPTEDDLTAKAAAIAFERPLFESEKAKTEIKRHYMNRKRKWNEGAMKMAHVPKDSILLSNSNGSAPGFLIKGATCQSFFFPGVPVEMKPMAMKAILSLSSQTPAQQHRFFTMGIGESTIASLLNPLSKNGLSIGYRATRKGNTVKLHNPSPAQIKQARQILKPCLYSETDAEIARVVVKSLSEIRQTLATAESCTGGMLSSWLVDTPGASSILKQGVVVYSNESKTRLCNVDRSVIESHGAVSKAVAIEMAEGVRQTTNADWGIATTGIAGPGGGSKEKPVGTVHVAIADKHQTIHKCLQLHGTRTQIRESAAAMILFLLFKRIEKTKSPVNTGL